jgi:hypothetical protein
MIFTYKWITITCCYQLLTISNYATSSIIGEKQFTAAKSYMREIYLDNPYMIQKGMLILDYGYDNGLYHAPWAILPRRLFHIGTAPLPALQCTYATFLAYTVFTHRGTEIIVYYVY